jgi:hypothetical protein
MSTNALAAAGITQITTIPMITFRLPYNLTSTTSKVVSITSALSQNQWFIENKTVVPKIQSIIHSRDVVIFYANRRYQAINISQINQPYSFTQLPMTISGWEKMNTAEIEAQEQIKLGSDLFDLRSVVTLETSNLTGDELIVGCSTCIKLDSSNVLSTVANKHIKYDPIRAMQGIKKTGAAGSAVASGWEAIKPVMYIPHAPTLTGGDDWMSLVRNKGTVFIYVKDQSSIVPGSSFGAPF